MSWLTVLGDVLFRAACLVGLAIAPPFLAPEPELPATLLVSAAVSLALLVAAAIGARRLRAAGPSGRVASAMTGVALIVAVVCAAVFRGDRAPLGRGLLGVALPLWPGLAAAAGAVAERLLGASRRPPAALIVLAIGALLLGVSGRWMFSPQAMWARSLDGQQGSPRALDALVGGKLRAHDYRGAVAVLDRCLADNPRACPCLAARAEARTEIPGADRATLDRAVDDARAVVATCRRDADARAMLAIALAFRGDGIEAESGARDALREDDRSGRLHYALALALDRQGRAAEALREARRAVDLGAGRDADLMLGALLIKEGDLDGARRALDPLAADRGDAAAQYDRALIADRTGDYNAARQGYLAALTADGTFASARYNLAVLTLRRGVVEEAKHHAAKFAEAFPDDPRNADLQRLIAAATAPRR